MTENEIRKRLAQYYQSTNRHHAVYINLVPGNYLPRFDLGLRVVSPRTAPESPVEAVPLPDATAKLPAPGLAEPETEPARLTERKFRGRAIAAALIFICAVGVAGVTLKWTD